MVFQTGIEIVPPPSFLVNDFRDAENIRRLGFDGLGNPVSYTEDQRLLRAAYDAVRNMWRGKSKSRIVPIEKT
jgi:hypothetical protein